jgi:oligopeptide/dipeptide ABC transporter ATP-binding protein
MTQPILEATDIVRHFPGSNGRTVHAVNGVSLSLQPGEIFSIVGESGCGKSTLGRMIVRLDRPDQGRITVEGRDIGSLSGRELHKQRTSLQMIFQDPSASLDPRWTIEDIIREPLDNYGIGDRAARKATVAGLLQKVGLRPDFADRYPHELSGGQKQRVGIARALALSPKVIVADEPVSALDVSVRAQVVNLLCDLKDEYQLSVILIAHDIGLVAHVSSRIAVMYLGRIVEMADAATLASNPRHPYTRALFDAVPVAHPSNRRGKRPLEGDPPSPIDLPAGCAFASRCAFVKDTCRQAVPKLEMIGDTHSAACIRVVAGEI